MTSASDVLSKRHSNLNTALERAASKGSSGARANFEGSSAARAEDPTHASERSSNIDIVVRPVCSRKEGGEGAV